MPMLFCGWSTQHGGTQNVRDQVAAYQLLCWAVQEMVGQVERRSNQQRPSPWTSSLLSNNVEWFFYGTRIKVWVWFSHNFRRSISRYSSEIQAVLQWRPSRLYSIYIQASIISILTNIVYLINCLFVSRSDETPDLEFRVNGPPPIERQLQDSD